MIVQSFDQLKKSLNEFGCPYPANQGKFFFRGIPNESFELIPPLFYPPAPKNPKEKETEILNEFINQTDFGKDQEYDHRIWLNAFYARHWGLKSRLIDWTIDLSVALFFMLQNASNQNAALFVLPKNSFGFSNELPKTSYFEFDHTIILNPPFYLDDIEVIASKNRFIQHGRFLVQNYNKASQCFYKKNFKTILKIEISQNDLKDIYDKCCNVQDYDPTVELMIDTDKDPFYDLCQKLNKL